VFTHRHNREQKALLTEDELKYVVETISREGKSRKKTFRSSAKYAPLDACRFNALDFLFSEGYILPGPRKGPLEWLTATSERYPRGPCFSVSPDSQIVWLANTGMLWRIKPESCDEVGIDLGRGLAPDAVATAKGDRAMAVFSLTKPKKRNKSSGTSMWRSPAGMID
jgi:hypothetical protein